MQIKRVVGLFSIIGALACLTLISCDSVSNPDNKIYHTVKFNTDGGSAIPSQKILHGEKVSKPKDPVKSGYHLVDWTYNGESWSFAGHVVTEDMALDAIWELTVYTIDYELNNGIDDTDNPYEYTTIDSFTLEEPNRRGYTFLGWFDEGNNQVEAIEPGMTGNLVLTAHWNEGNEYTITFNPNGGIISDTTLVVQYDHSYSLPIPTRAGYSFDGWYDEDWYGSTKVPNSGTWRWTSNESYIAKWNIINYPINYLLNDGTNNSSNPATYTINDSVTFADPEKAGSSFEGWFDNDNNQVFSIDVGTTGEITIEAKWTAHLYVLSVTSGDNARGSAYIDSGEGYSGESITVVANPNENFIFKGWYNGAVRVSTEIAYTFNMPPHDYSLEARFTTSSEQDEWNKAHGVTPVFSLDEKTVTYGLYPQKLADVELWPHLRNLSGPEENGYYLYGDEYYANVVGAPYDSKYTFDNGNKISSGNEYWFKCEPITWYVTSNGDGYYYLLSSLLLDCYRYNEFYTNLKDGHYANNYQYSDIRIWLNNDFYNTAFTLGDRYIKTMLVDNSASTTDDLNNSYVCDNTQDKVFLPSYKDYCDSDFVTKIGGRKCKTTEWARASGACVSLASGWLQNGYYWTRTPCSSSSNRAWTIYCDGQLISDQTVGYQAESVRPAIALSLS